MISIRPFLLYLIFVQALFFGTVECRFSDGKPVDSLVLSTSAEFEGLVATNQSHVFTLFHSFLCKPKKCARLAPHWIKTFDTYNHYSGAAISILALDCTNAGRAACLEQQVDLTATCARISGSVGAPHSL